MKIQIRSAIVSTVAAFAPLMAAAQPAVASDTFSLPLSPAMSLSILAGSASHTVCAYGSVNPVLYATGVWELAVTGTRTGAEPIIQFSGKDGGTFGTCLTIPKMAASSGQYHVTFIFVGVGSSVFGRRSGFGSWQPALPDVAFVSPA